MVQCVHDTVCMMDDVMDLPDKIAGQYRKVVCPPSSLERVWDMWAPIVR